ncbi:MAG: M23 family metallopeptidase [Anaerolineales bacterium]|nr:M23 family metallopeptidase [Anaerolineales bacterium]
MSSYLKAFALPEWFRAWIQYHVLPYLGLQPQVMALGVVKGMFDMLLLLLLGFGFLSGSRLYMGGQYTVSRDIQSTVLKWAPISNQIAQQANIPREVPLVLWFKENSMKAENPGNCTGIIGAYDLVRSGSHACFTPGSISDIEVREQLKVAAAEFKKRCPEITFFTQDPDMIKRCYFAYNAGTGAASRLDANDSAYVMNNYDEAHQNMIYSDIELGTVQVTALGAWPAHLAFQSLITSQVDAVERPFSISLLDMNTRIYDMAGNLIAELTDRSYGTDVEMAFPAERDMTQADCLGEPHRLGRPSLRPRLNPVTESPILTQDVHGCSYSLPGLDISSDNNTAVLQAPIPGEVTTYTDRWYNSTIRIENDEWIVWLLHPRSYFVEDGEKVSRGQAVGVMGSVGFATGPHVHYALYDKVNETFVDPRNFLP